MIVTEPEYLEIKIEIEMPKCELESEGHVFTKYLNSHDLNVLVQDKMLTWKSHVIWLHLLF